jgi:hypothetical protein
MVRVTVVFAVTEPLVPVTVMVYWVPFDTVVVPPALLPQPESAVVAAMPANARRRRQMKRPSF